MVIATLVAVLPMSLVGVGLLVSPAVFAACLSSSSLVVGPIPESLTAATRAGETVTLNHEQLTVMSRDVVSATRP